MAHISVSHALQTLRNTTVDVKRGAYHNVTIREDLVLRDRPQLGARQHTRLVRGVGRGGAALREPMPAAERRRPRSDAGRRPRRTPGASTAARRASICEELVENSRRTTGRVRSAASMSPSAQYRTSELASQTRVRRRVSSRRASSWRGTDHDVWMPWEAAACSRSAAVSMAGRRPGSSGAIMGAFERGQNRGRCAALRHLLVLCNQRPCDPPSFSRAARRRVGLSSRRRAHWRDQTRQHATTATETVKRAEFAS